MRSMESKLSLSNKSTQYPVIQIGSGSVFKTASGDIMMKLMNPEVPKLANISEYPVWAADVGNGKIKQLDPREMVELVGVAYDLIDNKVGGENG